MMYGVEPPMLPWRISFVRLHGVNSFDLCCVAECVGVGVLYQACHHTFRRSNQAVYSGQCLHQIFFRAPHEAQAGKL